MRASRLRAWPVWLLIALLGELGLADVLTTKSGGRYEGEVQDQGDSYLVIMPGGSQMTFPRSVVVQVEKGPVRSAAASVPAKAAGTAPGPGVRPQGGANEESGRMMEVVATGAGSTPDEALQSAYSTAIEQVVGVLVDAETLVKNDQIVSDKIRTFSRGFVRSYDEIKRWEDKGVHFVRIRAKVAVDSLNDALKSSKVSTREVPGDLLARQIRFDVKNETEAAEMLAKILAGLDMTKLTKVELVGEPETKREGANAKMLVKAKVSPDMAEWQKFSKDLQHLLDKTATKRGGLSTKIGQDNYSYGNEALGKQLRGEGILVALLTSITGDRMQWNLFRVPETLEASIQNTSRQMSHSVAFAFLAQDGKEILRTTELLRDNSYGSRPAGQLFQVHSGELGHIWIIGPVWQWNDKPYPVYSTETTVVLSAEDLGRVAKVAVALEKTKGKE